MDPKRVAEVLRAEVEYLENNYLHLRAAARANRERFRELSALLATVGTPIAEKLTSGLLSVL